MNFLFRIPGLRRALVHAQRWGFNAVYARRLGHPVEVFGLPLLQIANWANIRFGHTAMLISDTYFSEPGISHPVIIRLLGPAARLTVGNDFGMSGGGICVQTEVRIGHNVLLGANTFITDTDFHSIWPVNRRYDERVASRPVVLEDNVFVGMNSLILKGVRIGCNAVIGAGSVVSTNVPANEIWGGNPARFLRRVPGTAAELLPALRQEVAPA
jgi:acetyltransferase-like isoleucine patch superfamily enzyme